jgi:HAD superfamily hydrolase (TIGR01509 family)
VDALLFDFDGLILDTEWPAYVTVADVFADHGAEMPLDRWQSRIGRGDNEPWINLLIDDVGEAGPGAGWAAIELARDDRKNAMTDASSIQPGVLDLLTQAEHRGLATAVASSSPLSWVGRHLERLGIHDRFGAVRTRDDVQQAKPWPDVFLAASQALGVDPARCVVFEDSHHGVVAAKTAGMYAVAVPNRITAEADFSAADLVVSSLEDVDLASLLR